MPKLTTAQKPFTLLVANLRQGSDPSKGTSGNPVKLRTGFTMQHLPQVSHSTPGEHPGPVGDPSTPGTTTQMGLLDGIPTRASGTITVADSDFTDAAILYIGDYVLTSDVDYVAVETVANVYATGTATVVANPSTATLTIGGQALTDAGGARTPGSNDYDGTLGTPELIAADIVAAINDAANGFAAIATAVDGGGGVVNLTAVDAGTAGNAVTLTTSDVADITVSGAVFSGGVDAVDGLVDTATNLAAVIDGLPGSEASAALAVVSVTAGGGQNGNSTRFESYFSSTVTNFTLSPAAGYFAGGLPALGPPTILT